ncbi:hypothetical protein VTI74DRAFT_2322 [Chaetomium olivicolor]
MYWTKHFRWWLVHMLTMLTHLGLIIVAAITYVYDVGKTNRTVQRPSQPDPNMHPCSTAFIGTFTGGFGYDMTVRTLLMTSLTVVSRLVPSTRPPCRPPFPPSCCGCRGRHEASLSHACDNPSSAFAFLQGTLGLFLSVVLLIVLMALERHERTLTEGEQHCRKLTATFFGCTVNLLLTGAAVGLASTLGVKAAENKPLIAPVFWASIQAYVH